MNLQKTISELTEKMNVALEMLPVNANPSLTFRIQDIPLDEFKEYCLTNNLIVEYQEKISMLRASFYLKGKNGFICIYSKKVQAPTFDYAEVSND